jgi:hypothetical protein
MVFRRIEPHMTLSVTAMRLLRIPESFDNSDWIFEPKMDGFRALAHVTGHRCTLVSRNGHVFKSWPQLAEEIRTASARTAPFSTAKSAASNRMGRAISRICYSGVSGRSSWRSTCPPWAAATSAPWLFQRKRTRGSGSPTSECRLRSAQPLRAPRL